MRSDGQMTEFHTKRDRAKLSAWIDVSVRRIVIHFPSTAAYADVWRKIARSLGAIPT